MVRNFKNYVAWTDAFVYEYGYAGMIGYQRKNFGSCAHMLWVIAPNFASEYDAKMSANKMLNQIRDINNFGKIIYIDGVML